MNKIFALQNISSKNSEMFTEPSMERYQQYTNFGINLSFENATIMPEKSCFQLMIMCD